VSQHNLILRSAQVKLLQIGHRTTWLSVDDVRQTRVCNK